VDISGVKAFLPGSQIDLRPVRDLDQSDREEISYEGTKGEPEEREYSPLEKSHT